MQIAAREILTTQRQQEPVAWWGFYVEALEAGATVSMAKTGSPPTVSLEYSVNGGRTWSSFDADGGTTTVTLTKARDRAYFRAVTTNARLASSTSAYHRFVFGKRVAVGGNILSLLSSVEISAFPSTATSASYCLVSLFRNAATLEDASALVLPDSAMPQYCYYSMFQGCTSLTAAPALPATKLATYCYYQMFYGCTSLTAAPALPATTLATYCYYQMFYGCTSLTAAPALPTTTLAYACYQQMFQGCTSLTSAPALPATTLADYCYSQMFYGCPSLTAAPALPATTLATYCYSNMFRNCSTLRQITTAHTAWSPTNATTNWVSGVSSSGTFSCPAALGDDSTITRGTSACPTGWTVVNV